MRRLICMIVVCTGACILLSSAAQAGGLVRALLDKHAERETMREKLHHQRVMSGRTIDRSDRHGGGGHCP